MPPRLILALLACLALTITVRAQSYGLASRPAFTAFNGGTLPPNASTISGTWSAVPVANWPTFSNPMGIVQEPGTQSMIVWEREGRVYRFDKATGTGKMLMLDLSANTQGWDDCGMLNLICHPNYTTNKYVFIYYVWVPGASSIKGNSKTRPPTFMTNWKRLSRFTVKSDGTIDKASETVLVHQKCQVLWHSGSGMFFHPTDGFLYFINGDDFIPSKAQKVNGGIFSGIFRIDVDQRGGSISHPIPRQPLPGPADNTGSYTANYFIPNDNPLVGQSSVLEEYFALGVRSPHRLTYDAVTGRMFHSDVGDETREEVNVVEPGEVLPNYQWPKFEGLVGDMTQPYLGLNKKPIIDYAHTDGSAVIGGYVYRGTEFPELFGKYIFGDNMNGTIWYLDESTTPATKVAICKLPNGPGFNAGDNYLGLSSFGIGAENELYLVQLSTSGGRIYKLSRTGGNTNQMPATLSAANLFSDLANLTTNTGFVAYDVITPLWSDGAEKKRWFAVPTGQRIGYAPSGEWSFPTGSVFVKHFDLPTDETNPTIKRRLETRLIVRDNQGFVYGGTYKWRNDLSDADLVTDTQTENITITTASGTRSQTWTFPGRSACLQCHTPASKGVLGLSAPQNHRDHLFTESGVTDNQLRAWNHVGYFTPAIDENSLSSLAKFAAIYDSGASVETRVRSYLDSNCSHCHRPGGVRANWDARFETPLASAGIVNGAALRDLGVAGSRIITPADVLKSVLHKRLATATETYAMPPLAKAVVDAPAVALLAQWINSLTPPTSQPVSAPWSTADIGNTALAGSTAVLDGQFTVNASGADYGGTGDDFRFVYRDLTGDGTILTRWVSGANESVGTLAGVTMRESLATGAKQVSMLHMPGQTKFVWRISPTSLSAGHDADMPWLRLRRAGSVFTASISADGQMWTQVGSQTITMASTIKVGLALCGRDNSKLATAVFDNVQFMPGVPWFIDTQPRGQLARVGDLVEWSVGTTGDTPPTYQWRKNGVSISRAVSARYAFKAALTSAASYSVLTGGKLASASANLVVIDKPTFTNNLPPGATATFTLPVAGTGATYQWTKDGVPLQNGTRIQGATTSKLSVKLLTLADIGDYECVVTAFGTTLVQGPCSLHVLSKPAITSSAPAAWSVSRAFSLQLTANEPVTSYVVSGLPSGVSYNASTGLISGTPNVGGSFTVKVYARNAAGSGALQTYTWSVESFPAACLGTFVGMIPRAISYNRRGGLLTMTTSPSGAVTGTLRMGTATYPLKGRCEFISWQDPTYSYLIVIPGGFFNVAVSMSRTTGVVSGVVSADIEDRPVEARRTSSVAAVARMINLGYHNVWLDVNPSSQTDGSGNGWPQGTGWARMYVNASGAVTMSGRMADGASISGTVFLRDNGTVAWFKALYGGIGSVYGDFSISHEGMSGTVQWFKEGLYSLSKDHSYPSGFDNQIDLAGSPYQAPQAGLNFLGDADAVGNANLSPSTDNVIVQGGEAPYQVFRLTAAHKAIFSANPNHHTMTINASTGFFSGSFVLHNTLPSITTRTITYQGLFRPGQSRARGSFIWREMPNSSTSPIHAGLIEIY